MQLLTQLTRFPFYLWIAGVYPILHLYAENFGLVRDDEAAQTIAVMLITTSLAYLAAKPFIRNSHKSAFFLSIASLYFSTSGHLYTMFVIPRSLLIWNLLSGAAVVALLLALHKLPNRKIYASLTAPFNLIAAALLALQIITLLAAFLSAQRYADANSVYNRAWPNRPSAEKVMDSPERPDIYYIIPDGYPSDAALLAAIGYDNADFTEALRERGFTIAPHAQSNYIVTVLSLPSILNMKYFEDNPSQFSDLDYLQLSIANNGVAHRLQQLGYTYVQFLSGFLYISPSADIVRDFTQAGPIELTLVDDALIVQGLDEGNPAYGAGPKSLHIKQPFVTLYLDATALRIVHSQLQKISPQASTTPYSRKSPERFLAYIDNIDAIVAMPEATFTIMHSLKPNGPVTFDAHGNIIPRNSFPSPDDFTAELSYINSQFLRLIDTILQGSQNPPVIIFQADHGSRHLRDFAGSNRKELLHDAYASYYLPGPDAIELPSPHTLVNSFPMVLNHVFGMDLELQENRLFQVNDGHAPFEQVEVTAEFLHK